MVSSGLQPDCEHTPSATGFDNAPAATVRAANRSAAEPTTSRRRRRPQRRELRCPAHPETALKGTGRKYFLHLVTPEELKQRGLSDKRAKLAIQAHPVLVLSNEWLEELWCPHCGESRWCHVIRHDRVRHTVRWAPRDLWQQVAHVDPVVANPSVSEFSRRAARRDARRYWEN